VFKANLSDSGSFVGIYDFSYAPYALGDVFTWQVNVCIKALAKGKQTVHHCLMIDPMRPSSPFQPHITPLNYNDYIGNLFPAFLCSPMLSSVKIFKDRKKFNYFLFEEMIHRRLMWPNMMGHAMEQLDYSSHGIINEFFKKHQRIPKLKTPKGYDQSVDDFLERQCTGRFLISVNIRQRSLYASLGFEKLSTIHFDRDSPLQEWYRFFKIVQKKYPDCLFLILGGYSEWEKELYRYENVLIPRAMGFQLAHELALFHKSRLFMGTSSGFSALATFSEIPYIITNFDHAAAKNIDLSVGSKCYPFATKNQILSWEKESTALLLKLFELIYNTLQE
jgi:hypothetical protein